MLPGGSPGFKALIFFFKRFYAEVFGWPLAGS
jgi:hypothetical protein